MMTLVSGSIFCQFFLAVARLFSLSWDESVLGRFFRAVAAVWTRWWHGSVLVHIFFEREGVLSRAWPQSRCCKFLSLVVNLPVAVLHWIYVKLRPWFEGSILCPFIFGFGELVPVAIGWAMVLFMNIDYWEWSNGYSLIGFIFLTLLFLDGGMRRRSLRLDLASVGLYPVLFFAAVCLSWPLSFYPELSGRYLTYHITCALCVVLVVSTVEDAGQLERLSVFGCLGMTGTAVYGVFQRIQGIAVVGAYVDAALNPDMPGRVYSFYENPNAYAEMLVFLIPVAVGLTLGAKKKTSRLVGLISAGLGGAALLMTYCRASWVGLAVAAVVFLFFWKPVLLPVMALAGLAVLPLMPKAVLDRVLTIFNPSDTTASSRLPLMQAGLRMIRAHPILGAGLGADAVRQMCAELRTYTASYARFTHSHNLYLQLWLEHGLLGVASFVAACWHMLRQSVRTFRSPRTALSTRMIVLGSASALAGSLVSGLADYLFTYPRVMLIFWFSVSLLMAGVKLANPGRHGHTSFS